MVIANISENCVEVRRPKVRAVSLHTPRRRSDRHFDGNASFVYAPSRYING